MTGDDGWSLLLAGACAHKVKYGDRVREHLGHCLEARPCKVHDELGWHKKELERLNALINTPHTTDFFEAVRLEAIHQRERWGTEHDAGKAPSDWFWLLGYLAGKALHNAILGENEKALHHVVSSAAALLNWHAALTGTDNSMRPGTDRSDG